MSNNRGPRISGIRRRENAENTEVFDDNNEVSLLKVKEVDLKIQAMQIEGIFNDIPKLKAMVKAGTLTKAPAEFFTKIVKGGEWFYLYIDENYNWVKPTAKEDIETISTTLLGLDIDIFFNPNIEEVVPETETESEAETESPLYSETGVIDEEAEEEESETEEFSNDMGHPQTLSPYKDLTLKLDLL